MSEVEKREELLKAAKTLVDEFFVKDEEVSKAKPGESLADAHMAEVPGSTDDDKMNHGRPKEISDVPKKDKDGKRASSGLDAITSNKDLELEPAEAKTQSKTLQAPTGQTVTVKDVLPEQRLYLSKDQVDEYEELKKAKADSERKEKIEADEKRQKDIVKAAVSDEMKGLKDLVKSLVDKSSAQDQLLKSIDASPATTPKAITNVDAIEKAKTPDAAPQAITKSTVLDALEKLWEDKKIPDTILIDYEMTNKLSNEVANMVKSKLNI